MGCGGCAKRKVAREQNKGKYEVMDNYAELQNKQIKVRLEAYKKKILQMM